MGGTSQRPARLRHPGEAPSPDSRAPYPLLTAAPAVFGGQELSLLYVEAPPGHDLPFVETGAAQRLVVSTGTAGDLEFDDVGHP